MNKERLLDNLFSLRKLTQRLATLSEEQRKLSLPYFDVTRLPGLLKIVIIFITNLFLFFKIVELLSDNETKFVSIDKALIIFFLNIIGFFVLIFILVFIYGKLEVFINRLQINFRKKRHAARMKEIIEESEQLYSQIGKFGIPLRYCYPYAINKFISYLYDFRADTLKECINIFEQEQMEQQHLDQLKAIKQLQEDTYYEAHAAKNIALLNFFMKK